MLTQVDHWDDVTRGVVLDRVHNVPPFRFFDEHERDVLKAFCDTLMAAPATVSLTATAVPATGPAGQEQAKADSYARQAAVYAQRAANFLLGRNAGGPPRLVEDGQIGEQTLAAIHALDPREYYQALCEQSKAHYRHVAAVNPAQAMNLNGWLKRAAA